MDDFSAIKQKRYDLRQSYFRYRKRKQLFICVLIPALFIFVGIAVSTGSASISFADVVAAMLKKLFPGVDVAAVHADAIVWQLRLPRIAMGGIAGMALGCSGAVMQVVLRNPLADPYMLGIASSASFGASLGIIFGIGFFSGSYLIIGNAFAFSLLSSCLLFGLAGKKEASPESMVLTGLALLFFFRPRRRLYNILVMRTRSKQRFSGRLETWAKRIGTKSRYYSNWLWGGCWSCAGNPAISI